MTRSPRHSRRDLSGARPRRWLAIAVASATLVVFPGSVTASGSCDVPSYDDRCEKTALWVSSRIGALWPSLYSPESRTIAVAGSDYSDEGYRSIEVAGFDARSGRRRWSYTYDDEAHEAGIAKDAALSRDGRTAFVTGLSEPERGWGDWVTFGVSVRSGRVLWRKRFGGMRGDVPSQVVVHPRNSAVYVAGEARGSGTALVAYDAASGRRLWVRERSATRYEYGIGDVEVRGRDVYVVESSYCHFQGCEAGPTLTRAAPSRKGFRRVWTRDLEDDDGAIQYSYAPVEASDRHVFLVGVRDAERGVDFVVSAFRKGSGEREWTRTVTVGGGLPVTFPIVAFDPFRRQLLVGESYADARVQVAALAERTGRVRWQRRLPPDEPFETELSDLGAARRGVYAAAWTRDPTHHEGAVTTIALRPRSGRVRWTARYHPPGSQRSSGYVRFAGGRLFVPLTGSNVRGLKDWVGLASYRL